MRPAPRRKKGFCEIGFRPFICNRKGWSSGRPTKPAMYLTSGGVSTRDNRSHSSTLASNATALRRSPKIRQVGSMPPEQPMSTNVNRSSRRLPATNDANAVLMIELDIRRTGERQTSEAMYCGNRESFLVKQSSASLDDGELAMD